MSDIHLKIDGIRGESTDARHRDEIVVESWAWGVAAAVAAVGAAGGSGVGRPTFSDLTFSHRVDRASPLLWDACASGRRLREALLSVTRVGPAPQDYLSIRLRNVAVTAVALADTAGDGAAPLETVSLAFDEVRYGYRPQRASGQLDTAVEFEHRTRARRSR